MRMGGIDGEKRAIGAVAEDTIPNAHGAGVTDDIPFACIRPLHFQYRPGTIVDLHVVDVPGELMDCVSPRRRAAHHHAKGASRHVHETDLDLHPVVLSGGKADVINDRGLRKGGRAEKKKRHTDQP